MGGGNSNGGDCSATRKFTAKVAKFLKNPKGLHHRPPKKSKMSTSKVKTNCKNWVKQLIFAIFGKHFLKNIHLGYSFDSIRG